MAIEMASGRATSREVAKERLPGTIDALPFSTARDAFTAGSALMFRDLPASIPGPRRFRGRDPSTFYASSRGRITRYAGDRLPNRNYGPRCALRSHSVEPARDCAD